MRLTESIAVWVRDIGGIHSGYCQIHPKIQTPRSSERLRKASRIPVKFGPIGALPDPGLEVFGRHYRLKT